MATNTAPSTPGLFTITVRSSTDHSFNVAWGASSDDEGNLSGYILERSVGNGTWVQIYNGRNTAIIDYPSMESTGVMYRVKAYDSDGAVSAWRLSDGSIITTNTAPSAPPSISVPSNVNGGSTLAISWTAASDSDGNLSGYILERSTDGGGTYTQVYKGSALTYTDTVSKSWATVMYRVKAYDSDNAQSGYTTSPKRTVIHNAAPTITASTTALGQKNAAFAWAYTVADADGDPLTVKEVLDGKTTKTRTGVTSGTALTFEQTSTAAGFQRVLNGSHTLTVDVSDGKETVSKSATFTKAIHSASITLAKPLTVDDAITVAVLQVTGSIPEDATYKVEITNNALDSSPVWQDATKEVKKGANIVFANKVATAGPAFNFRVSVERGVSGEGGYIEFITGAFQ